MLGPFHLIYTPVARRELEFGIGQSHDFCQAYSLFVARVASFAPERSEGATRATNKLYAQQKSCDYHYHQYTRPNRTNLFHKVKIV